MLYGNYCYIIIENFPKKFSPCTNIIDLLAIVVNGPSDATHIWSLKHKVQHKSPFYRQREEIESLQNSPEYRGESFGDTDSH